MIETEMRPVRVALTVALHQFPVRLQRLSRMHVVFPDFGKPFVQSVGFIRYRGERRFKATAKEVQFLRRLTTLL